MFQKRVTKGPIPTRHAPSGPIVPPPEAAIEQGQRALYIWATQSFALYSLPLYFFLSKMAPPLGISDVWPAQVIIYPLSILALLIPAPVHFKSGNIGVILLIIYTAATQLILLINSIIWRGNIDNPAPYWCDLAVFILAIAPTGISGAFLCITRQLHKLSKAQAVRISQSEVSSLSSPL